MTDNICWDSQEKIWHSINYFTLRDSQGTCYLQFQKSKSNTENYWCMWNMKENQPETLVKFKSQERVLILLVLHSEGEMAP